MPEEQGWKHTDIVSQNIRYYYEEGSTLDKQGTEFIEKAIKMDSLKAISFYPKREPLHWEVVGRHKILEERQVAFDWSCISKEELLSFYDKDEEPILYKKLGEHIENMNLKKIVESKDLDALYRLKCSLFLQYQYRVSHVLYFFGNNREN